MEDELGQKLFSRGSHRVSLTPEGRLFYRRAEEIIDLVEKTTSEVKKSGEMVSGDVYIGGAESYGMKFIADCICELHSEYPAIKFHLRSGNAEDALVWLDRGIVDFCTLIQPADISRYDSLPLPHKEVWGLVMREICHPLSDKESITREDLMRVPLICTRQMLASGALKNPVFEWLGKGASKLNIVATYNLIYNALLLVNTGVGCALSIDRLIKAFPSSNLCFRPLTPRLESKIDIVWKKNRVFSKAAEIFLEKIREKMRAAEGGDVSAGE